MHYLVGIDYGKRRIGVALASSPQGFAMPLAVLTVNNHAHACLQLKERLEGYTIDTIVLGLPLMLDGQEGERVKEVRAFAAMLSQHFSCKLAFQDERLTSKHADSMLRERGLNRKKRTKQLDAIAAQLLLQDYLDSTP